MRLNPPIVLLLDDGLHRFSTLEEIEKDIEAIDVRSNPSWRGYDASGLSVQLTVAKSFRKVFWTRVNYEKVSVQEGDMTLDADIEFLDALVEALSTEGRAPDVNANDCPPLTLLRTFALVR